MSAGTRQIQAREWLLSGAAASQPRVKLCGMFRDEDVQAVAEARPDLCGFIVDFPKSYRSVTPARLAGLCDRLLECEPASAPIWRVGVFVDEPMGQLVRIVDAGCIDLVQLHGSEDAAYIDELRDRTGVGIIQAFRIRSAADAAAAEASAADLVLLDNGQGTGEGFDWSLVASVGRPFMLAGGLGPENVAQAIKEVRPWGVDMSSGIESEKFKDPAKMAAAVAAVRKAVRP